MKSIFKKYLFLLTILYIFEKLIDYFSQFSQNIFDFFSIHYIGSIYSLSNITNFITIIIVLLLDVAVAIVIFVDRKRFTIPKKIMKMLILIAFFSFIYGIILLLIAEFVYENNNELEK